ncbi:hypothetical protein CLV98_102131 [Dyadobacter jejuensis]|uniref:Uncharacterized protein n=1 Tax=Dyadobacter jejuensis TaxID=1082580 RepID=A0A316APW1_9BACT|nr:hypothetical protein [Dyadobacter jejuensis]PWJ59299.1 hypothetical protein CLV98_102131 [Dyadobacter jejuensis]
MNIIYTVCNRKSLPHALALGDSVRKHQPTDRFVLGWVDDVIPNQLPKDVELLEVTKLGIPQWEAMKTQYYTYELLAATRPWFAQQLIGQLTSSDRLIFLAPTVVLWTDLQHSLQREEQALFTPQANRPIPKSALLKDHQILNTGMFHAGSWILSASDQGKDFLGWWAQRTQDRAYFDLCQGMCMDQLWLNYAPIHLPNWGKLAADSWHYGLNKLAFQDITLQNSKPYLNNMPVWSTDFAGITFFDPIWSDYSNSVRNRPQFATLLNAYQLQLDGLKTEYGLGGNAGYGKVAQISPNRLLRNRTAKKIKLITTFIDNY